MSRRAAMIVLILGPLVGCGALLGLGEAPPDDRPSPDGGNGVGDGTVTEADGEALVDGADPDADAGADTAAACIAEGKSCSDAAPCCPGTSRLGGPVACRADNTCGQCGPRFATCNPTVVDSCCAGLDCSGAAGSERCCTRTGLPCDAGFQCCSFNCRQVDNRCGNPI